MRVQLLDVILVGLILFGCAACTRRLASIGRTHLANALHFKNSGRTDPDIETESRSERNRELQVVQSLAVSDRENHPIDDRPRAEEVEVVEGSAPEAEARGHSVRKPLTPGRDQRLAFKELVRDAVAEVSQPAHDFLAEGLLKGFDLEIPELCFRNQRGAGLCPGVSPEECDTEQKQNGNTFQQQDPRILPEGRHRVEHSLS